MKLLSIKILILLTIIITSAMAAPALIHRNPSTVNNIHELENVLTRLVAKNNPPGLSIAVVKNSQLVYTSAFGFADAPNQIPAKQDTVYHWWSMTKIPTAIAIMQLHEQGKINIDDPVRDYLAWFEVKYKGTNREELTIRHLLSHTSGMPDTMPAMIGWVHQEDEILDQTVLLKSILPQYKQLRFNPGSRFSYSNLGYLVLGAVIEQVSGDTYEAYVLENILKPSGMQNTNFIVTPTMQELEATGSHPLLSMYTPLLPLLLDMKELVRERDRMTLWFNRLYLDVTPSSGLIGSANDVVHLMEAYLKPHTLLSEGSKGMMMPGSDNPSERPLGWAEYSLDERQWIQHRGGGPGFASLMRLYPHERLGIAILANGTNLDSNRLAELIARLNWG